jgi:hypothetical protein
LLASSDGGGHLRGKDWVDRAVGQNRADSRHPVVESATCRGATEHGKSPAIVMPLAVARRAAGSKQVLIIDHGMLRSPYEDSQFVSA